MDTVDFARFALAFCFVLGLIGLCAFLLRRFSGAQRMLGIREGDGRVQVLETRYLDSRRRLVLVRRDQVEHLILLGEGHATVVESGIKTNESEERA